VRVCLLTPEFMPTWGGVGTYTYNLARGLHDKAEVHVLTARAPASPGDGDTEGVHVHSAFPDNASPSEASPLRFQLAVMRHLPRLTRENGFDLIHANHAYMSDLFAQMRRTSAAKVLTVHTTLDTQIGGTRGASAGTPRQPLEGKLSRWRFLVQAIERRYLARAPSMIFVSRWVRDRTLRRYRIAPRLSTVVPNAIDTEIFASPTEAPRGRERPTLLFAGRLLALKGIDTLLRAMIRIRPEVRLLLAGPGDSAAWRLLARRLALSEDRCRFLGPVPYARMPALYHEADAVVLPSYAESYPMVALEALSARAPLIASNVGGISEIVRDEVTGWLFPPGDVARLAERIETVLADPARARQIASNGRAWVEAHAPIGHMIDGTVRFYNRVLEEEAS